MQEQSAQAENELWNAVGEAFDMEMSTVEDVLESLTRTQKWNVKYSIENCMTILYRDPLLKDDIWEKMAEREGVTEQLKAHEQMLWVQRMNGIRARAEEIVMEEIIYTL